MAETIKDASLATIRGGAAIERFDLALAEIAANIADPNTRPTDKRKIILEVTLQPSEDRESVATSFKVVTKPAPLTPVVALIYIGNRNGKAVAVTYDPAQDDLFQGNDPDVLPLRRSQEGSAS